MYYTADERNEANWLYRGEYMSMRHGVTPDEANRAVTRQDLEQNLRSEADYAESHPDEPIREGSLVTHRGQRSRMLSIRMSESEFAALERVAGASGVPVSRLAREWIAQKLATESSPSDLAELAEAVAVLAQRLSTLASSATN